MNDERPEEQQGQQPEEATQDDGPDVSELDQEPDYEPEQEGLKDLKGG